MPTWKLTLEYDGSNYHGWQEQTNAKGVANDVRKAAEEFFGTQVELQASGRTDAGVHALAQVAHLRVDTREEFSSPEVLRGLNEKLPTSIVILNVEEAHHRFHARHDATSRAYIYRFSTRRTAFEKKFVWWIREKLDVEKMDAAAQKLIGRHDFAPFAQGDPSKPDESTIVVVTDAAVVREENLIIFRIEASHFLWKMVRRLAGLLMRIGSGELSFADFELFLEGNKDPRIAQWTAPASGLFLEAVTYGESGASTKSAGASLATPERHEDEDPSDEPAVAASPRKSAAASTRSKPASRARALPDDRRPPPSRAPREYTPRTGDGPPRRFAGPPRGDDRPPRRFDGPRDDARPPRKFAGPPRGDDRPPRRFDGPRDDARPPRKFAGPPRGDGPPRRFDGPRDDARPPRKFGPPRGDDRPPRRFDGPRDDARPPRKFAGPPRGDGPPRKFGPPRGDGPPRRFDGPRDDARPPRKFAGPPRGDARPPRKFDGPSRGPAKRPSAGGPKKGPPRGGKPGGKPRGRG